jgi:hypothetical protein
VPSRPVGGRTGGEGRAVRGGAAASDGWRAGRGAAGIAAAYRPMTLITGAYRAREMSRELKSLRVTA